MIQLKWKYIWPYVIFMVTIGVAVGVNMELIKDGIEKNDHYARSINLAGRQRLLSQRLISDVLLAQNGLAGEHDIQETLPRWNRMHHALQEGDTSLRVRAVLTPNVHEAFAKMNPVQSALFEGLSSYKAVADSSTVNHLIQLQRTYVAMMDETVDVIQADVETEIHGIKERQMWAAFLSGLVLILEILIFVIPYHKKLIVAYAKLKHNKVLIQEQAEEIQQQMLSLAANHDELARLNATKELTLEGINAGVWDWDIVTGKEEWSPKFLMLLGYADGELPATFDTFLNVLLHKDDKEAVQTAIGKHLMFSEPYHINIRMLHKSGKYRWFEASGKAAKDVDGKAVQMAGSIIDIEEKMIYQQQLEGMNRMKDKMFAIISHDLRSPLNGVKGLIELQSLGHLSQQEFEDYIEQLKNGVDFTIRTLDNMLVWAMAQMNSMKAEPTNVSAAKVFDEVEQFHRYSGRQKKHTIQYKTDEHIAMHADANHVFVILRNLVGNAIKFTPENGNIIVTALLKGSNVAITVSDSGVGMKAAQIEQLLGRQEHASTYGTNGEKGTGLGINLVMDLIALNGGSLSITSEEGKGSQFTVLLPAA